MESTSKALYQFFSGFGIPAYGNDDVPDDAELPYLTVYFSEPEWNTKASGYCQVWYRTNQRAKVNAKADAIAGAIAAKPRLECDGGYIVLWPENPLVQPINDGEARGAYINFSINAYHMPGM